MARLPEWKRSAHYQRRKKSLSQEAAECFYFERHLKFFLLFWSSNGKRLLGFLDHHQADLVANAFFVESLT